MHVSICVCPYHTLFISSVIIYAPYDWLYKFYSFYTVGVVSINGIEMILQLKHMCSRNHPSKNKIMLHNQLFSL